MFLKNSFLLSSNLVVFLLIFQNAVAQIQIVGKVIDNETKKPISNAIVRDAVAGIDVKTNFGGYFQISMDTSHHLLVLSQGYLVSEVKVNSNKIQIMLVKATVFYPPLSDLDLLILQQTVIKNTPYPPDAIQKQIQGRIYVSFEVDTIGRIQNAVLIKDIGYECGQTVLKALDKVPFLTATGEIRTFILPVTFKLQNSPVPFVPLGSDIPEQKGFMLDGLIVGYGRPE